MFPPFSPFSIAKYYAALLHIFPLFLPLSTLLEFPPPASPFPYSPGCPAPVLPHMIIHPHRCTYFFNDDHNTKLYLPPPPFTNSSLVSFTSHKNKTVKVLLDWAYSFSSYPGCLFFLQMPWNPLLSIAIKGTWFIYLLVFFFLVLFHWLS